MKKHLILCAIFGLFCSGFAISETLSPEQALARFQHSAMNKVTRAAKQTNSMQLQSTLRNLYVFSSGIGFIILPNDDRATALLAYSDADNFSIDDNPALKNWLDFYNRQLDLVKTSKIKSQAADVSPMRIQRAEIKPMLSTEWNQESPYNMLCPKVDGHETVTGCVATAMSQLMKYYNYPVHGNGTYSYYWEPGNEDLSFDYENTTFQWDLMTDKYDKDSSEESKQAVAKLMLACGISVNMHYEPGESGASTARMGEVLKSIFAYSPSIWMPSRSFYSYDEWEDMIYSDLAEGMPVLYSGQGTAGGHQFICDGYSRDGYFHFNWGWGGLSNGYFLLTALNPDDLGVGGGAGGFNTDQIASLSVRPAKSGDKPTYIMYNSEGFTTDAKTVAAGDNFVADGIYYNYSLDNLPEGTYLGMIFTNSDGEPVKYVDGSGIAGLHLYDGRRYDEITFPELPDGTYTITPAIHVDGEWIDVRMPVGYPDAITATVINNVAQIANASEATIAIVDIDIPQSVYTGHEFPMPFTVENTSDQEYYSTVTPYLINETGDKIAKSDFRPLDVLGNSSQRIADYIADFAAIGDNEYGEGDYQLVFYDAAGKQVSEKIDIKIETTDDATEIAVSDFRLDDISPISEPDSVRFSFKVDCTSGVYFSQLHLAIFPGDGGYELYGIDSDEIYLTAGEEKSVSVTADLSRLDDGRYQAIVYNDDTMMTDGYHFRIERPKSDLTETISDSSQKQSTIYRIDGIVQKGSLSPGLYIIDGKVTQIR